MRARVSLRVAWTLLAAWTTSLLLPETLAQAPVAPVGAPASPMAMDGIKHNDMQFTAPKAEQESIRVIGDDRFKDEPIVVSPKKSKYGTLMIIEGDVIVGRRENLLAANLDQLRVEARLLDLSANGLGRVLRPDQLEFLKALQSLPVPSNDAELRWQATEARVVPLVKTAAQLVKSMSSQAHPLPPSLTAAADQLLNPRFTIAFSATVVGAKFRWPSGVIPYYYDANSVSPTTQRTIEEAVKHWNATTDRIFLRPTKRSDPYWINFVMADGCASNVGKTVTTGEQQIFLADGCPFDQTVHEIGHAVGLFHEQTRNDRDTFLSIQPQNMQPGTEPNFQLPRRGESQDVGPFDFASVMLYASDAFSSNGQPTMIVKDPFRAQVGDNWGINHRAAAGLRGLSKGDVNGVKAMYANPADRSPNLDLNRFVTAAPPDTLPVQPTPPTPGPSTPQPEEKPEPLGAPKAK